jgi:thiol:disulfide interchange protein DsbD
MKKALFVIILVVGIFSISYSQTPSKQELERTAEEIYKLIKRDSINNLIIQKLKKQVGETTDLSLDTGKTLVKSTRENPVDGGKIMQDIGKKIHEEDISLFAFLILAFGAGLVSLLTPCVFPMIPLTVTFFTNTSERRTHAIRKALFYGFSIILIFTLIGTFAGPFLANDLSTHWIPNLAFFIIFIVFGLSFLGLFDITLPSSFINKVDAQSEKGGFYGVFFMAFTLVLVSFSCTVPIVSIVLAQSAGGEFLKPFLGMLSYSVAFGIPFTLFALFPQWLKKLPKSGGWLNVIKVTLGFFEIAMAFKFLSMVDQVYHLRILDREIYIAIWIVIFSLMGIYLLGKIKLPHDSDEKNLSVPRLILAMIPLVFVVYLIPGMFGAPLKALSGYMPPLNTHDFDIPGIIREYSTQGQETPNLCSEPKFGKLKMPHGLKGYFTYDEALKCAKEKGLPMLIDFTGHACANCREVEATVWSDPDILKILHNDYVIASLYVDDKTLLAKEDWYTSKFDNKLKKTLGAKNSDLSVNKFGINAQPFYILLDPFDEQPIVTPAIGYETSIVNYLNYLNKGISTFKQKHPKK